LNEFDVPPDEMRRYLDSDDREIDGLLSGRAPEGDAELGELARFFTDLREAYPEASTAGQETAHLAAMIETAHLLAENGEPVARPASNADGPAVQASGLPKWRRSVMGKSIFASTKLRVAAVAAAFLLLFSGTALAASRGALPGPIQNAAADAAAVVGVDVPTSDEGNVNDVNQGDQQNVDQGNVNDVNQGDQQNVEQGSDNDENQGDQQNVDQGGANDSNQGDAGNSGGGGNGQN
jgi:hypothetical protein